MNLGFFFLIFASIGINCHAEPLTLTETCVKQLSEFPGKFDRSALRSACEKAAILDDCYSFEKTPIFHLDKSSKKMTAKNILVFSLIHGDEIPAGSAGRYWMERLDGIDPRNNWRVVPILNPDGVKRKTRTNANKIDVNRNFPTKDWQEKAIPFWKSTTSGNPRRFPGDAAASEPETKCALKHIDQFKPDFIVSIHTPLKVLDYDGPKIKPPTYEYLPWKTLGHYPGSLGRYMWFERKTPVLTMELREELPKTEKPWIELQDIIGFLVSIEFGQPEKVSAF